jgi:ornithine cyclodeaminase/alanine dehydrogenase
MTPPAPTIEADWLEDGVTGISIDYDSYWTAGAMRAMDLIVTDDRGQIDHLKEYGLFHGVPKIHGELGDIAVGKIRGRKSSDDKILCFNLGIAVEDLVTAVNVYHSAVDRNVGTVLQR